jgi:anti-sigma regulatory factor (Ser/Thr protein kinase)
MSNRQAKATPLPARNVKETIRALAAARGSVQSGLVARELDITRQAVHYHLREMVAHGELRRVGAGRGARYERVFALARRYPLDGLAEDAVWREVRGEIPGLSQAGNDVQTVLQYAFTEMLNNAIDHSGGSVADVAIIPLEGLLAFEIHDDGVGAVRHAAEAFGLVDPFDVIAEFNKGKRTSARDRHSGEGIFFTSKAVDTFVLAANGLRWTVDNTLGDQAIGDASPEVGTRVRCEVLVDSRRTLRQTFDRYSLDPEGSPAFDQTIIRLELQRVARSFLSRSEAKRVAVGLEAFDQVEIDFGGITDVGQGFVDELFRVWADEHPGTHLIPLEMSPNVRRMVQRGGLPG